MFFNRRLSVTSCDYLARLKSFSHNARQYLLFVFLTTLNQGIYGVIFNLYILSLGFREDFLGLILSLSSASIGLFAIPAALICDCLGRKNTLLLSSVLYTLSLIFLYNSTSRELLAISSIAYGVALALSLVTGGTFLVENSTAYERMHLFSMYYIIYTVSILSGNMVGGFLPGMLADILSFEPEGAMSYRLTLYVSLAATIISLLPLSYIKEKSYPKNANMSHLKVYKSIFQSKTACRMIFIFCLYGIGWGVSLPYFNVYFDTILGADTSQIGIIFSASQLTMVIGYFLVPMLTEKLGKIKLASIVQVLSIPFLLMFTFTSSVLVAALGYVMRWLLMNMANPILNSFKLEIVSNEQRTIMNSLTWMACYTFVGIGTYAGGLLMARGQNAMPFLITSVFYGITAILYYVYFNEVERRQNA
ncbi:MAG TPA: MFS transporter [Methanothrix sp.]|nr:MFS transporter [Methanothrix sp.]HOV51659.1 MFS transporter [Methanothrix sp.]